MDIRFTLGIGRLLALFLLAIGISFVYAHSIKGLSDTDKKFVEDAYKGGLSAIALAEVAMTRTQDPSVKDFAKDMREDHSALNEALMQLAAREGLSLPKDMGENGRKEVETFSRMSGRDFDRAYIDYELKDHEGDLAQYSREVKEGSNPALKTIASRMVPKLEHHLSMAGEIGQKVGEKKA